MNTIKKFSTAFAMVAMATAAHAYPGNETDMSVTPLPYNEASASAGFLSFTLDGYGSIDGANGYEDDFTVYQGTTELFAGTFNLGGGGTADLKFVTPGSSITGYTSSTAVTWAGGQVKFIIPVALTAGANTFTFAYTSVKGGDQGTDDESWDVQHVNVSAVPEPTSMALLLAGLGIVGGLARRRVAARRA